MEKYKIIVLVEEIKNCLQTGEQKKALKLAEKIDCKKVKNMSDLSVIAECYFQNRQYAKARELFLAIYAKNKSRRILAQLVHLSIKLNETHAAESYLAEFIKAAPDDFYQYIFRFSIDRINNAPLDILINDLVALKKAEYIDNWGYELAKLYYKAGRVEECIAECEDLALWFGNGDLVEKAKALKALCTGELTVDHLSSESSEEVSESSEEVHREDVKEEGTQEKNIQEDIIEDSEEICVSEQMESADDIMEDAGEVVKSFVFSNNIPVDEIFCSFLKIKEIRQQIYKCMEDIISQNKKDVAMIITGEKESGKTRLGKDFAAFFKAIDLVKANKIALITSDKLNEIDIFGRKDQLKECVLIIENAGELRRDTLKTLLNLDIAFHNEIIIILEDSREKINRLLRNYPELNQIFLDRVHLKEYTKQEYEIFAADYLTQQQYEMIPDALQDFREYLKQETEFNMTKLYSWLKKTVSKCEE